METVTGTVKKVLCHKDSGWAMFILKGRQGGEMTITGIVPKISEGALLEVVGDTTFHPKYGMSFKATSIQQKIPSDVHFYASYLMSQINGIGISTAEMLVNMFGKDTLDVVMNQPDRVAMLPRIGKRKAESFSRQMRSNTPSRAVQLCFAELEIGSSMQRKILETFGGESESVLRKNPYAMVKKIRGVGFQTSDKIAEKAGIPKDSPFRIQSGMEYVMEQYANLGHSYLPQHEFISAVSSEMKADPMMIRNQMTACIRDDIIVMENGRVYLKKYYDMETDVAKMLVALAKSKEGLYNEDKEAVEQRIIEIEQEKNVTLDNIQRKAVMDAVQNNVMVITGGPGTGKTTVLDIIIRYLKRYDSKEEDDIVLVAPTGKAAKRMHEQTGMEASTIHRLAMATAGTDDLKDLIEDMETRSKDDKQGKKGMKPKGNKDGGQLECRTVIADEFSMVNLLIAKTLFTLLKPGTRLIVVGDVNQLPAIGVGQVLKDIINSGIIKVCMLENIYRQAAESHIITNAHKINRGEFPDFRTPYEDFMLVKNTNKRKVIDFIKKLTSETLPKMFNITPFDVQILCPLNGGDLGVDECNKIMQEFLNPPDRNKKEYNNGKILFRTGDKIIHSRNNYSIEWVIDDGSEECENGVGIFNGEVGIIESISTLSKEVTILYDDEKRAVYSAEDMLDVRLAYAMTVHKSQGSEYPAVIIPLLKGGYDKLYNKNLLYTGITRAKSSVALLGDPETVWNMVQNTQEEERYSSLMEKISQLGKTVYVSHGDSATVRHTA